MPEAKEGRRAIITLQVICLGGSCIIGGCDCTMHNGKIVEEGTSLPPFHGGCECQIEQSSFGDGAIRAKVVADKIRHREFSLLRRTVGSKMWLDGLSDNERNVLFNEILNVAYIDMWNSSFKPVTLERCSKSTKEGDRIMDG